MAGYLTTHWSISSSEVEIRPAAELSRRAVTLAPRCVRTCAAHHRRHLCLTASVDANGVHPSVDVRAAVAIRRAAPAFGPARGGVPKREVIPRKEPLHYPQVVYGHEDWESREKRVVGSEV